MMAEILDACFGGDFMGAFCAKCEDMVEDCGLTWCPADDDPSDGRCPKRGAYMEIQGIALGAERDMQGVVEQWNGKWWEA